MMVIKYLLRVQRKMTTNKQIIRISSMESNHLKLQFRLCLIHKFAYCLKLSLLMKKLTRIVKEVTLLLLVIPSISLNSQLFDCSIAVWATLWFILKMIQICILNHSKGKSLRFNNLKYHYPYLQLPHHLLGDSIFKIWISTTCICLWNTNETTPIYTMIKQLLSLFGTTKNRTLSVKNRKLSSTIDTSTYSMK